MVSQATRRCIELVEQMLSRGYRLQISQTEVERLIKIGVGADKRTVQKYMKMLTEDLAFLKAVTRNPYGVVVYRIDVEAIEHFASQHMKEKLKQTRLSDISPKQEVRIQKG